MQLRSLYQDPQDVANDKLTLSDRAALDSYICEIKRQTELASNSESYQPGNWSTFARNMIKQIIWDALVSFRVSQGTLKFQLYCTGSLGKEQATPYSDVDGFVAWEDPKGNPAKQHEIEQLKKALAGAQNVFQRIFLETNQFCPDPIGITPFNYQGTVDELYQKLVTGQVPDVPTFIGSITTAKPFFGDHSFLNSLCRKVADNSGMVQHASSADLYRRVVEEFAGPRTLDKVQIKRDVFRPLDFFMMALRKDYNIGMDTNHPLPTVQVVDELLMRGKITHEFADLILSIFEDALKLRTQQHLAANRENDLLELKSLTPEQQTLVRGLIDKMAILRGVANQRLQVVRQGKTLHETKLELHSLSDLPYMDRLYDQSTMVINPSPYVYSDPAREYFESNRALIRQNLAQFQPENEDCNVERILDGITRVPTHLQYLSETLTYCFEDADIDDEGQIIISGEAVVAGSPLPAYVAPTLDKERFAGWCRIVLQNAKSDLFDAQGNLNPWIKRLINKTRPGVVALDESQAQAQVERTKKSLLRAYFYNIVGDIVKANPVLAGIDLQAHPELFAQVYKVINDVKKECLNEATTHDIKEFILDRHVQFKLALREFKQTVQSSIDVLREIRSSTLDKRLIAKVDDRLQRYGTLCRDIDYVANLPQQSSTLQSSFLHKSYCFFEKDFSQFEKDLKNTEFSLWTWVKEKVRSITNRLQRIPNLILTKDERVTKVSNFFGDAKRRYEEASNAGAFDTPTTSPESTPTTSRV